MANKVIIVGCGWLGQQVAPELATAGFQVFGSRRTAAAAQALPLPIIGMALPLTTAEIMPAQLAVLRDAWVICTIPPGGRKSAADSTYLQVLTVLATLCQQAGIKGGIHISSTGVYQGLAGEVDESAALQLAQPRVALLAAGEQLLRETGPWLTLRLAGLMGPGRHPGRFVQGKTLSGAAHPVNMVHSADVAKALLAMLASWPLPKSCYNLSSPMPVTKKDFYQVAAAQLGYSFAELSWQPESAEPARRVLATALSIDTDFDYQYPDPRQALAACG